MISSRLKSLSSLIECGEDIYDIGCDHALLDIYLTLEKGCCCHCFDVNSGIVNRAISNIKKYNLCEKIDVKVGNGFDDLGLNSSSLMVLAGMGTGTILRILEKNHTNDILCQTNTDIYLLRKKVCEMGYYIVSEKLVFDNKRFYVSIRFSLGRVSYSYDQLLLGPCLIDENSVLFKQYVKNLYDKYIGGYNKSLEFNGDSFNDISLMINCLKRYI